jgi:serine/threonine protein kinase
LVQTLLNAVAELHVNKVAHRDLGLRNVWVGSTTHLAISGFTVAALPHEEIVDGWMRELAGYALPVPAEFDVDTDWQLDVYSLGMLAREILFKDDEHSGADEVSRAKAGREEVTAAPRPFIAIAHPC